MKIKGNKAIITNGAIETIYEMQQNGDLIKLTEKCGGIVIWTRPNAHLGIKTKGLEIRSISLSLSVHPNKLRRIVTMKTIQLKRNELQLLLLTMAGIRILTTVFGGLKQ